MGKIFGIADLPISTIMSPFEPIVELRNPYEDELDFAVRNQVKQTKNYGDVFVSKSPKNPRIISNPIIKMRNGFGKLMKHFSGKI